MGMKRFQGEWQRLKSMLDSWKGTRLRCLDLGCGNGIWLQALSREFEHVEGWDYAPEMLRASRRRLKAAGVNSATLRCGQITARAGKAVFDYIFVGGVLMYTPDKALGPLLESLVRLLKPGGRIVLRETTVRGETWMRQGKPLRKGLLAGPESPDLDYVAIYRSRAELQRRLQEAGFTILTSATNVHYKLSDLCENWLHRLNFISCGSLGRSPILAGRAAALIYALRYALLYPEYWIRQILGLMPWPLENRWFECALKPQLAST